MFAVPDRVFSCSSKKNMAAMWSRNDNSVIVLPVFDLISIFTVDLDDKLCLDFFPSQARFLFTVFQRSRALFTVFK